ncbi:hypothetical protein [Dongia sp. agr-C8]
MTAPNPLKVDVFGPLPVWAKVAAAAAFGVLFIVIDRWTAHMLPTSMFAACMFFLALACLFYVGMLGHSHLMHAQRR